MGIEIPDDDEVLVTVNPDCLGQVTAVAGQRAADEERRKLSNPRLKVKSINYDGKLCMTHIGNKKAKPY